MQWIYEEPHSYLRRLYPFPYRQVEDEPPAIIQEDPRSILYHSRDTMLDEAVDLPESRRRGWRRMVLFGLFFQPSGIRVRDFGEVFRNLKLVKPEMKKLGEGAIPFDGGLYLVRQRITLLWT